MIRELKADLYHRVSIRKYTDEPVEKELIEEILRAGMQAPSTANQQPWEFYVVTDRALCGKLGAVSKPSWPAAGAPVVIVTAYREASRLSGWAQIDLSICMENMWLAADALGLGAVWLGIAPNEDRMKDVEQLIGMPEGIRAFGLFALGHPAESKEQEDRFKPERIHWL